MDIEPIIRKVAHKYGLDPDDLEAGEYPPEQMKVLMALFEKCVSSQAPNDFEAYITAKAQMLYLKCR